MSKQDTHGSDCLLRLGFVACVAAICWALFCWAADDEATYRAAETPCQPIAGPDYRAPCQLCGRRIVWVPMPCECVWPPVPMDATNWAGVRQ